MRPTIVFVSRRRKGVSFAKIYISEMPFRRVRLQDKNHNRASSSSPAVLYSLGSMVAHKISLHFLILVIIASLVIRSRITCVALVIPLSQTPFFSRWVQLILGSPKIRVINYEHSINNIVSVVVLKPIWRGSDDAAIALKYADRRRHFSIFRHIVTISAAYRLERWEFQLRS